MAKKRGKVISHITDWHFDGHSKLHAGIVDAVRRAIRHTMPDLYAFTGDLAGRESRHAYTVMERLDIVDVCREAAERAPVLVIGGNHDGVNELRILRRIRSKYPISVVEGTPLHVPASDATAGLSVAALPYVTKADVLQGQFGGTIQEQNRRAAEAAVRMSLTDANGVQHQRADIALVHLPTVGAPIGSYEVSSEQEVVLEEAHLALFGSRYVGLGHIHARGQVTETAFRAGSPVPLVHGEKAPKGFVLAEAGGKKPDVSFVDIPSWDMMKLAYECGGEWDWATMADAAGQVKDCYVKVDVELQPGVDPQRVPKEQIKAFLRDAGALDVTVGTHPAARTEARGAAILQVHDDVERVAVALDGLGVEAEQKERALGRFKAIKEEVRA